MDWLWAPSTEVK